MQRWHEAWSDRVFRQSLLRDVLLLGIVLISLFFTLDFVEHRQGIVIERGWLNTWIRPIDLSIPIFILTYGATIGGLALAAQQPHEVLRLIRIYLLLQGIRIFSLLLVPLDPPEGILPLNDPILQNTFYAGRANLKDLFFSGHTATILMYGLVSPLRWKRWVFATLAVSAGVCLAIQRVHYVSDVISAPLFVGLAYWILVRWEGGK